MSQEDEPKFGPDHINFLVVTANVGTLFENLEEFEETWINELIKVIEKHQAQFIALHCQEIGGKDYKSLFDPVIKFFEKLSNLKELKEFTISRGFLDGDCDDTDQFTALGNIYLVHKSVTKAEIFDFKKKKFANISGKNLFSDNISDLSNVRKEKFDQEFFPECKWSRKGYIRVRWKIYDKEIEFVNVHLFHDDSNLKAVKQSPSQYTAYRKQALQYVMSKLNNEHPLEDDALLFVFGDFNFRLDVRSLIQDLFPSSREQVIRPSSEEDGDDVIRILYRSNESNGNGQEKTCNDESDDVVVTLEKKYFKVAHTSFQPNVYHEKLRRFDLEFSSVDAGLKEYDISFPPTYPYSESLSKPTQYMRTRCPSWCDRVLLSSPTWNWLHAQEAESNVTYNVVGSSACMGDHKPVYLSFTAPMVQSDLQKSKTTPVNGKNSNPPTLGDGSKC